MLLIDDFIKFTGVNFHKKKSDAAVSFKAYKTHVERQHQGSGKDYVIKAVRTDDGGEYTGEAFQRELGDAESNFSLRFPIRHLRMVSQRTAIESWSVERMYC